MNAHEHFDELAVGHALNALEPADEMAFLAHLPGCAACERAVAEHNETLGHLAYATAAQEPPPALLEGIRAGVAASGRAGAFPAPAVASLADRRNRTVKLTTALVGVAASFVLVAALVLANVALRSNNNDLKRQDVAFQRTVSSLLTHGAKRVELSGKGDAVAVVHGGQVDLVLSGVKANDVSREVYVLWQQDAHGITAAGTFDVTSKGLTVINKGLSVTQAGDLKALMVTREAGRVAPKSAAGELVFAGNA